MALAGLTMVDKENGLHNGDEHGLKPSVQRPTTVHIFHPTAGLGFTAGKRGNFSREDDNIGAVRESQSCGCLRNQLVLIADIAEEQIDPGWELNGIHWPGSR